METIHVIKKQWNEKEIETIVAFEDPEEAYQYCIQKNEVHKFVQFPRYYIDPINLIRKK